MIGRPQRSEAVPDYFAYIDLVSGEDPLRILESQLDTSLQLFSTISEEKSLHRYAPEKWSIRQLLNHVTDTERAIAYRALWFARGFSSPLVGYDSDIGAAGAGADNVAWAEHVEEFRLVRLSTIALFRHLPPEAWMRTGVASNNPFTVRALPFFAAGHVAHHIKVLRDRYF